MVSEEGARPRHHGKKNSLYCYGVLANGHVLFSTGLTLTYAIKEGHLFRKR